MHIAYGVILNKMTDNNQFKVYGGLDARKSLRKTSDILSYTEAKNIDIKGKGVRRARGQTQEVVHPSASEWVGLAVHEVDGIQYLRGINADGGYYRITLGQALPTAAKTGLLGT